MSAASTAVREALGTRRLAAVVVAAVTAVSLGVSGGLVLATDITATGDARLAATSGTVVLDAYGPNGTLVQRYTDGDEVTLTFTLVNGGPLPIVIERIDAFDTHLGLLSPVGITLDGASLPVRLPADGEVVVDARATFDNCEYYTERALERHDHATVTWSVLGLDRTSQVGYGRDVVVRSPTIAGGCSDRVMDRSAKRRSMDASPTGRG